MGWSLAGHWSYTGDPSASHKDAVRFAVGDVDDSDQLVSDEEIEHALGEVGSINEAAAMVCEHIAARFSREADKSINASGGVAQSQQLSQRSKAYMLHATRLRTRLSLDVAPFAGGTSAIDKQLVREDGDRVPPSFEIGMLEYE